VPGSGWEMFSVREPWRNIKNEQSFKLLAMTIFNFWKVGDISTYLNNSLKNFPKVGSSSFKLLAMTCFVLLWRTFACAAILRPGKFI
jgi:hypothetical protein